MHKLIPVILLLAACPPDEGVGTGTSSSSSPASSDGFSATGSPVDPTTSGSSSSSGEGSSSGSSSSGGSSTGAAEICDPIQERPWGKCGEDRACDQGFCLGADPGICVSTCEMGTCDGGPCGPTECRVEGSCVLSCPCLIEGMICDDLLGACVWT